MTREEIVDRIWGDAVRRNINIARDDVVEMVDFVLRKHCPEPQGLDEAPKKKLRKVCNLREDLKDEPIEEKLAELRKIRAEKDRLDEAAVQAHIRMEESGEEMSFLNTFKAGAEWMARQGVSMQVTDDTEWSEVDLVVHKNVCEGTIIQIRKK